MKCGRKEVRMCRKVAWSKLKLAKPLYLFVCVSARPVLLLIKIIEDYVDGSP